MFSRIRTVFGHRYILSGIIFSALILTLPSLWNGICCDDYFIRGTVLQQENIPGTPASAWDAFAFVKVDPEIIRRGRETGLYPWWMPDEFQMAFWRPLACLTHWLDFRFFAEFPWLMHFHNILWYALLAYVVTLAFRRFIPVSWVAGLAAFMYVADEARGVGVGWLAGRSAILATILGLLVLLAHDRWRRSRWKPGAVLAFVLLAVGLFTAEATLSICAYLLSYALFLDKGKYRVRIGALLPYGAVVVLWRIFYNHLGYGVINSGLYIDPGQDPGHFIIEGTGRLIMLLYTQFAFPDAGLWTFTQPLWSFFCFVFAVMVMGLITWILWPVIRGDRTARFFAFGLLFSALPMCTTLPAGRLLFFVGFGGMGLVAVFLATVFEKRKELLSVRPYTAKGLAVLFTVIHLILSPLLLPPAMFFPYFMGRPNILAAKTVPEPLSPDERFVFVNVPSSLMIGYLPYIREVLGYSVPIKKWLLSADFSSLEVFRNDDSTLTIKPENGFFKSPWAQTFCNTRIPVKAGFERKLPGLSVRVPAVTEDGRPAEVRYEFSVPLEDRSLRWLIWSAEGFVPFSLPAPGETVYVKRLPLLWWLKFS